MDVDMSKPVIPALLNDKWRIAIAIFVEIFR